MNPLAKRPRHPLIMALVFASFFTLLLALLLFSPITIANDVATKNFIKPSQCVTLHQGQKCFQKLTIKFAGQATKHFCLFVDKREEPLLCWQGALDRFHYSFESAENQVFEVKEQEALTTIAKQEIRVAWVYKSKKKGPTGWRLF